MAGITLETAKKHLEVWLEAEKSVATGQSYMIGDRRLTKADLAQVRREIQYWDGKVQELENAQRHGGRSRSYVIVPRDI